MKTTRLGLETLDQRDVPSTVTFDGAVVSIDGTSARDHVSASYWLFNQVRVTVTTDPPATGPAVGVSYYFPTASVQRFDFDGYAGDDKFANMTGIPLWANGGLGNDSLLGGGGDDRLVGGPGLSYFADNDVLVGGVGDDNLIGGAGADNINGGVGADRLFGDAGHDTLTGGSGWDRLYGGAGNDRLCGDDPLSGYGDGATDYLYGQAGADVFVLPCAGGGYDWTDFHSWEDDSKDYFGCPE